MARNDDPQRLEKELQFDLLVDGELPETQRQTLLTSLDQTPGQWRDLAIRFLQRQTEHTAVREFITAAGVQAEIPPTYAFRRPAGHWFQWRAAAALVIVGILSAAVGGYLGHRNTDGVNIALGATPSYVNVQLGQSQVAVPIAAGNNTVPTLAADDNSGEPSRRDVVIVRNDKNQAVLFTVTSPYIY